MSKSIQQKIQALRAAIKEEKASQEKQNVSLDTLKGDDKGTAPGSTIGSNVPKEERAKTAILTEKAIKNEGVFDVHSLIQSYSPTGMRQYTPPPKAEGMLISPQQQAEIDDLATTEKSLELEIKDITEKAYSDAQNAGQAIASEQSTRSNMEIAFGRGGSDDFGEIYGVTKDLRAINKEISATNVIEKVFNNLPQQQIAQTVEKRVVGSNTYKELTGQFQDEYNKLIPKGNNISDKDADEILSQLSPEEKEAAEKEIAAITQKIETLQAAYLQQVGGLYDGTAKQLQNEIYQSVINQLAQKELPKSSLEYIGKALYDHSLVGTFHNLVTGKTGEDVMVREKAYEMYGPSSIEKVVAGAGSILLDSLPFAALGGIGSAVSTGARAIATREVARQIARRAAVSGTNRAAKEIAKRVVERNALQQFATASLSSSITLGGYDGLLTAAQETLSPSGENGTINWRNVFHRMGEGALTGAVVGGLSFGTAGAKSAMYRARPDMAYTFAGKAADVGIGLAGFTAENAAFLGVGALASGEEITAETMGESFATLGVLKGVGILKRIAKGEKLIQQPDFVQRAISDLDFTKEEKAAMNKAGVDMEKIDIISEAVREVANSSVNTSQIAQEAVSQRPLMEVYNSVMSSREVPISAKAKLQYIVKGTVPRSIGATSLTISDTNGTPTVKAYDINGRLVQIREFANKAEAELFMKKTQPLLERNTIIEGEKLLRGGQIAVTMQQAIEQYAKENPNTDARALFTELMIDLGYVKGEVPTSSRERVDAIRSRIKEQFVDPASQLVDGIARKYGTTVESVYRALNIKPDLRTVRESQLVKAYVDGLKQFSESMSGPIEAEQARQAEQMRPQIEQGKREVEDAERETAFVRESLDEAAKKMATSDGTQIAIVRLVSGEQVAVHKGRIVVKENGTIDSKASEKTVVVKRFDAEGNEVRNQVHIDEIVEVVEQSTPEASVQSSMDILEAQAIKKKTLDKTLSENGEQGVEVVLIDGTKGKVVGTDDNGAYIFTFEGESGKEQTLPVSMYEIEAVNTEQPIATTTEQMAISDAVEKVVEQGLTAEVDVEYDEDFPPLTEADLTPEINPDNIQWDKLSQEEYATISAMTMGDATTLADSHIYYTNSRGDLAKAKQSVAEQQKKIDKLKSRFGTLSSPSQAQKLRKEIAKAEQEIAKREQVARGIEEQMAKYAYAMKKYGVEVAAENDLLAERTRLEGERNAILEADKELDRYEQEEATKGKKTIANTEANSKYIEQLYADRLGVSPAQAGPRQAILWDLANGAIKLRWDNVTTDSGAVQRGLQAELGVRGTEERRAYKAVIDNKNGQSVDAYVHDLWQNGEWGQEISTEELKDELLGVLQSTPNGSLALKELADMSGVQANLEAQISLGKGDIQRKLEEVDANLAKNAQQMADFRKRINNTVQRLERGEQLIIPVGEGEFGPIYDQFRGKPQEAVDFLLAEKNGEAIGALSHKDIGEIDLVWGKEGTGHSDGYGLSKLAKYHPEVLDKLQPILDDMEVVNRNTNRVNLESPKYQAAVRLTWNNERKNWLLTAFEKRNSAIDNTTDTGETAISGKQNDTATLQSTASENKDTTSIPENQISDEEIFNTPTLPTNEDIPFMIEQKTADKGVVSEAEQNFEREVFDTFAGHLGETLGVKDVVTDAAEAKRILEWHQAVGERLRTAVSENAEIAAERADIERVAKENGTWLKAPNGKDTKLTERQWVDVRTSRFKNWFVDWERNAEIIAMQERITKWLSSDNLQKAQGKSKNEILEMFGNDLEPIAYIPIHLLPILQAELTDNRIYSGKGYMIDHAVNHHPKLSAEKYRNIQSVINDYDEIKETFANGKRTVIFIKQIDRYNAVLVQVGSNDKGQLIFHKSFFEQKREPYAKLNSIRPELSLEGGVSSISHTNSVPGISLDARNDIANIERNFVIPNDSSKIVDENGEPKVVYHGTPNQFNTFNRELIGSSTDRGIWGRGFYFTSNKAEAERYTKRGDTTGEVKEVFLNIRKPLAIKAEQGDAGKEYIQSLYRKHVTDEIFEDPRTTDAKLAEATQKVTDELVENGYDGVVVTYKDGTQEYVVFNPNQIKSATENTGEYSPAYDDIRMSMKAYHGGGVEFDKFDLSFIGSGEGNQSFGYGVYITEKEAIAKYYADISDKREVHNNSRAIGEQVTALKRKYDETDDRIRKLIDEIEDSKISAEDVRAKETALQQAMSDRDSIRRQLQLAQVELDKLNRRWEAIRLTRELGETVAQLESQEKRLHLLEDDSKRVLIGKAKRKSINAEIERLKEEIKVGTTHKSFIESDIQRLNKDVAPRKGYVYNVEVPDDTGDNYIEWDNTLPSKMVERIYPHIANLISNQMFGLYNKAEGRKLNPREQGQIDYLKAVRNTYIDGEAKTGLDVYQQVVSSLGSAKAASEFLHSIGIQGVKMPALYTICGDAEGAKNYVIFNADDVKIVDHMQYFKTPNGEVYGFVYEDKIYLDPTNIDPKAPVHEYTELWCREVAKANEELWKRGKELVKQTKVWEEVNADENYKNQSEDLRASEAWSRIIADEMMGKAREYGSKGLMAKLRGWLRSFWKTVKSVVGKWTKKDLDDLTVDQFKKMTMADFINKVDPRKWNAKKPKEVSKSLVGIHNISLDKLQKALKQGGLANPSAAVIDIAKQNHEGYGEYSLIMPKSLVDATSGRNAGTFTGDAWTPTYPTIVRQLDTKGWEIVKNKISTAVGDSKELYADIVNGVRNFLEDNRSSKLEYVFLKEKGIEPEIVYRGADGFVGIANLEAILGVSNITEGIEAYERYKKADNVGKWTFNRWARTNGDKAEFAKLKALIKESPALKEEFHADLSFAQFDSFVNDIYKKEREAGNIDTSNTLLSASLYVDKNGLREEFESWIDTLMESAEAKEVFYAGIDRNGDRIYKPNTLENVSRHMLTEGMQNAYNNGGLSATKATLLQRLTTLSEIRQNKDRLSDEGKYNKEFDKLSDRLFNIITAISDMQEISSNRFMNIDYAELRLQDALAKRDPIAYLNKEYGYNIEKDSDLAKEIKSFIGDVRKMPAKYFETKFERPVMFNEFAAVVAPDTMPESVEQQLRDAGLAIYKYNPDVEGDRRKATLAATASEDIRFMIIGEKGAANLDAMEEATTRLDNLAVAREMEEEYQKAIKRSHSKGSSQDLTTSIVHLPSNGTKVKIKVDSAKENLAKVSDVYRGSVKTRGFLSSINKALGDTETGKQSHYFELQPDNNTTISIRTSNHNATAETFNAGEEAISIVIKSARRSNDFKASDDVELTEYVYFKEDIVNSDGSMLSSIADSISAMLTSGQYVDKTGKAKVNISGAKNIAKRIKLATGWERGADGKWRYETQDFIARDAFTKVVNNRNSHEEYIKQEQSFINEQLKWLTDIIEGRTADWVDKHLFGADEPTFAEKYPEKAQQMKEYFLQFADKGTAQAEFDRLIEYAKVLGRLGRNEYMLDEFVEDKTLLSAFPSLRNVKVVVEPNKNQDYGGKWIKEDQVIKLVNYRDRGSFEHTALLHEVQHAIQDLEGFAPGGAPEIQKPDTAEHKHLRDVVRGAISFVEFFKNEDIASVIRDSKKYGSPQWDSIGKESQDILLEYLGKKRNVKYDDVRKYLDNAFKMTLPREYGKAGYKKFAGEVEARNVGIRKDMTPEERRATLLSETEDVAREDQIFLENNLGVAQSVEVSEPVEAPTRKPRKSAAEKSLEKIESLREQLKNKKRSLNDTIVDVYSFLTSKDIAETMGEGVGKAQYRRVIKNSIEAIRKAYDVTDAEEKRKTVSKYLSEIDDSLSQLLTHQRLNEVTDILDKAIYGYTAQGVRTGKRIDEHTREIFDILRNAIGEPVEEERDDSGRRKPVHYRLKNRTEAGDITSSFRLRSVGNNEGIIAKLRSEADDIIASADVLDTATTRDAAQLEYTANLLELYDNALQLNEAIGQVTDEISNIQREIDRTNELYKAAATGSEEKKNLYKMRQKLHNDLDAERMNRAALRHRYASMLKTFTTSLEELDEKGADDYKRAELAKAEEAIKWRRGIYNSIKNSNAPVLPVEDYNRQGKEVKVNWKALNTRAKINESVFMATFAEMSRDIDINSIPGQWLKDGWYYQFMLSEDGYMARTDWRYKTEKTLREELNAEVLKLSGDKKTDEPYKLFAQLAQEPSGIVIPRLSVGTSKDGKTVGGYQDNIPLTIGQILYIRNTIRQPNGYAGYLAWGLSEEGSMREIAQYAEAKYPKYCRFADWVVTEFMPKLYEMQDAIYFEKFGTHLPKTAFYFPFVRDKRFVGEIAEVGEGEVSLPSSVTGNIVERVKTSAKMDLEADMFKVLQDHIKETLDWCAYVKLTDKFNSVATSHAFGNILKTQGVSVQKLKEMYEIAIGQGKINSTENTTLTKVLNAASKGLVAGNIVLNLNSAAKQLVSGSCALGYTANPKIIPIWAKNFFVPSAIKTGVGKLIQQIKSGELDPVEIINWKAFADNWNWAIENIPTLRERWEGRNAGFEVLKSHSFESWDKLSAIITNFGLAPNATVDMFTCANVAKTVYEYEYPRLLKRGRSKEEAHREACVKAAIFTNETQQSGIDAFLSSFQSGGGLLRLLGVGLGAYQNTSMSFARNERFAITNMLRMLNPNTKQLMTARQVEAYKEMGMGVEKATELAKEDFKESQGAQFSAFIHNSVVSNLLWTLAGTVLTTAISAGISAMFGGKEEWEKVKNNEKFRDELSSALSIETMAWQTPLFYNAPIFKQLMTYSYNAYQGKTYGGIFESPSSQSAQEMIDAVFKQWVGVKNDVTGAREKQEPTRYDRSAEWLVFSTLVKAGLGVNPDLVARMAEGIDDMMKDGVQAEDVMNVLSSPRGLTRAIAGEPRKGESKQQYLDRLSYIYRQVNAGSGKYDKKFVAERTREYIEQMDNDLYRELGIEPREVRILEQRVKAIRKNLSIMDRSKEGLATIKAMSPEQLKREGKTHGLSQGINEISRVLEQENLEGQFILPFDEQGVEKRKQLLKRKYELLYEVMEMWKENNSK